MQPNPGNGMNDLMRRAGNRSRALPNIGQTPAVQAANAVMGQMPVQGGAAPLMSVPAAGNAAVPAAPAGASSSLSSPSPMAAPKIQPSTFTLHPPGSPADPSHYNYEPQGDGSWRVYPPGVNAPPHTYQASLPRAASTADYQRMRQAFQRAAPS